MTWTLVLCFVVLAVLVLTIVYVIIMAVRGEDVELGNFYKQLLAIITLGFIGI